MKTESKKTVTTIEELSSNVMLQTHLADIPERELIRHVDNMIRRLESVNTTASLELAIIVRDALISARRSDGKTGRRVSLTRLALWAGSIELGWI